MNIVGASGSAIFVTGSSVAKFDIQFPDWTVNDQKNYYPYSVAAKLQTSYYPPRYNRSLGYMSQSVPPATDQFGDNYGPAITAPNGCVYILPSRVTSSIKINTTTNPETITIIQGPATLNETPQKYAAAALASNGCIYAPPYGTVNGGWSKILKINTSTDTVSTIDTTGLDQYAYNTAITAPNGYIYCISSTGNQIARILKINPFNDTWSTFGNITGFDPTTSPAITQFVGAAIAPNGVIYCAPSYQTKIIKIDTNTDTISQISISAGFNLFRFSGAVLAPNNECIYFVPNNATQCLKIDPRTDQITYIDLGVLANNYSAQLGPDGRIYCRGSNRVIIDPFTDTASVVTYASVSGGPSAMGFNGAFYSYGGNTKIIKDWDGNDYSDIDPNYILSRYRNKPY